MVTQVTRNWFSGLSSGLDTQGLIDKIMQAEHAPTDRLEQKRSVLSLQKTMLQDINLKLFETQTKATDLVFSRTFSSKKVTNSDEKLLTATATTSAKVGTQTVVVKQLATATKLTSAAQLAGPLELGHNIQSSKSVEGPGGVKLPLTIGGINLPLGNPAPGKTGLGITPGDIQIAVSGGGTHTISLGSSATTPLANVVATANSQISLDSELKGKIKAGYDEKTNQLWFSLLDTTKTMTISDVGPGTIVNTLYGSSSIVVNQTIPTKSSTATISSGLESTLDDLKVTSGTLGVTRAGVAKTLDFSTLVGSTTKVSALIDNLNHQLDTQYGWSGNPANRESEFRFDSSSQRLILVNKDSGDSDSLTLADGTSNLVSKLFGATSVNSTNDSGSSLANETFMNNVSAGTITIDGTQIAVNTSDTLQQVLARITASTDVNAAYDSKNDTIKLTRKDGLNTTIGIGSSADTSNFLSVTSLLSGNQQTSAYKQSQNDLGLGAGLAAKALNDASGLNTTGGTLKFTINGQEQTLAYNATDTLNEVLDNIRNNVSGISEAYYDETTHKVTISTSAKGTTASLKIENSSGTLATALGFDTASTATGLATGTVMEGSRGISGIRSSASLANAGFRTPITTGAFTINGATFTISNTTTTLDSLLQTITDNTKAGVKAEYDSTNGRILLTAKTTGASSISLGATTDSSNFLSAAGLNLGTQETGKNSIFVVKGVSGDADITRQTNQISDVVTGVTFNLKGLTDTNGETVDIAADTETARKAIDDFIKSYNQTMNLIYTKLTEKHDYTLEALTEKQKSALSDEDLTAFEENFQVGLLSGDTTLQTVRSRIRVTMAGMVKGLDKTFDALADIGITTGVVGSNYQDTQVGILKITDETKLTEALQANPDKVADLFARDSTSEAGQGLARRLKNTLNEFTKSGGLLTRRVGRSGVSVSNSEFDKQITSLSDQILVQETRLKAKEEQLIKQFSDLESTMSRYQSQSTAFSQQLAKLG